MPRYSYIKAEFNIPAIKTTWVEVPRIEIGIRILEAVGNGKLTMTSRTVKPEISHLSAGTFADPGSNWAGKRRDLPAL